MQPIWGARPRDGKLMSAVQVLQVSGLAIMDGTSWPDLENYLGQAGWTADKVKSFLVEVEVYADLDEANQAIKNSSTSASLVTMLHRALYSYPGDDPAVTATFGSSLIGWVYRDATGTYFQSYSSPFAHGVDWLEIADPVSLLLQVGSTPASGEDTETLEDVRRIISSSGVQAYWIVTGVEFMNRVAAVCKSWAAEGLTNDGLARLLRQALRAYGTKMEIDQIGGGDIQQYLSLGYILLCNSWKEGILENDEDKLSFVCDNMDTDKANYARAIEALGRPPRRKMSADAIAANFLYTNSNTLTIGAVGTVGKQAPSSRMDQLQDALAKDKSDPERRRGILEDFLVQLAGELWTGYFPNHKGDNDSLHLKVFAKYVKGHAKALLGQDFLSADDRVLAKEILVGRNFLALVSYYLIQWDEEGKFSP